MFPRDPELEAVTDIGEKYQEKDDTRLKKEMLAIMKINKSNPEFEKAARHRECKCTSLNTKIQFSPQSPFNVTQQAILSSSPVLIPLEEVSQEWYTEKGTVHQFNVAKHYGIYDHLFNGSYFMPTVPLGVFYPVSNDEDSVNPVFRGNKLEPAEVGEAFIIVFLY